MLFWRENNKFNWYQSVTYMNNKKAFISTKSGTVSRTGFVGARIEKIKTNSQNKSSKWTLYWHYSTFHRKVANPSWAFSKNLSKKLMGDHKIVLLMCFLSFVRTRKVHVFIMELLYSFSMVHKNVLVFLLCFLSHSWLKALLLILVLDQAKYLDFFSITDLSLGKKVKH